MAKANQVATVTYKGTVTELRFTLASMIRYEEMTGCKFTESFSEDEVSMTSIANLVSTGLLHAFPDVTPADVAEEFTLTDLTEISAAIEKAISSDK